MFKFFMEAILGGQSFQNAQVSPWALVAGEEKFKSTLPSYISFKIAKSLPLECIWQVKGGIVVK